MVAFKYGEDIGGWSSTSVKSTYGTSIWRGIRRLWETYKGCIIWKVGKGDRILFWRHDWLGLGILSNLFPRIFEIAVDKEAKLSDYYSGNGDQRSWTVLLRREVNDWEIESLLSLLELISNVQLTDKADSIEWRPTKNKTYSVKSFYSQLQGSNRDNFPWLKIWKAAIPNRVIFFSWFVAKRSILTIDNLQRRGYSLANRCQLCLKQEENINHLFLHCQWTAELWNMILSCFGVHICFPDDIGKFLLIWWGQRLHKRKKTTWNLVPYCLFWLIWKERNRRTFEDAQRSTLQNKSTFLRCLYEWAREGSAFDLYSLVNFLDTLN